MLNDHVGLDDRCLRIRHHELLVARLLNGSISGLQRRYKRLVHAGPHIRTLVQYGLVVVRYAHSAASIVTVIVFVELAQLSAQLILIELLEVYVFAHALFGLEDGQGSAALLAPLQDALHGTVALHDGSDDGALPFVAGFAVAVRLANVVVAEAVLLGHDKEARSLYFGLHDRVLIHHIQRVLLLELLTTRRQTLPRGALRHAYASHEVGLGRAHFFLLFVETVLALEQLQFEVRALLLLLWFLGGLL